MASRSVGVRIPTWASMRAWAMEPRMSWRQRRQSKLMDWEKAARSAAGPWSKRPEREVTSAGVGAGEAWEEGFVVWERRFMRGTGAG